MKTIPSASAFAASVRIPISKVKRANAVPQDDIVIVEEPMELQVVQGSSGEKTVAVTMRTPGHDFELALGYLIGEGVIRQSGDVVDVRYCGPPSPDKGYQNVVQIELCETANVDFERLDRNVYMSSSCGVCGKTSIEAVNVPMEKATSQSFRLTTNALNGLPQRLQEWQTEFQRTGGLHAAATINANGKIERVREDVGRHNAVDKLIGSYYANPEGSIMELGLLLSGRAGFELIQKAAVAGIGFVAAIGPPSNLAIELANERQMTLIGFLRDASFNVYTSFGALLYE